MVLGQEIDLQIALFRPVPEIVVAHQAVEIERRRRAGMGLDRHGFRDCGQPAGGFGEHPVGAFQRGALGQVDNDLEFRLVVEGQEFHRHALEVEGGHRDQGEHAHRQEQDPGQPASRHDGGGDAAVEPAENTLMAFRMTRHIGFAAAGDHHHQPGCEHHGDEEREDHCRRGIDRDRGHVGPHQAGHEQHGQQGCDHGEGGDDGGIAHFGHGLDGGSDARTTVLHRPVAGDILDHHDGVVDQDADGEDQREQRDAVDRVAHQIGSKQRHQNGGRDDDQHDEAFAPADHESDQQHDGDGGQAEMEEQLVGLLVGGLAVIAGDGDLDAFGDQAAAQQVEALQYVFGDDDRIGALALGQRQGDGGRALPAGRRAVCILAITAGTLLAGEHPGAGVGRFGADDDVRHIAHIDRASVARRQEEEADIGHALQGLTGGDETGLVVCGDLAGGEGAVGLGDAAGELLQGDAVLRQAFRIRFDADLVGAAAGDIGQADILDRHQRGA